MPVKDTKYPYINILKLKITSTSSLSPLEKKICGDQD